MMKNLFVACGFKSRLAINTIMIAHAANTTTTILITTSCTCLFKRLFSICLYKGFSGVFLYKVISVSSIENRSLIQRE
jgi:hypothetical protein